MRRTKSDVRHQMVYPSVFVLPSSYGAFSFALCFVRLFKVFSLLPLGKGQKMKKHIPTIYLVRANINKPFGPDNWYTFTEEEFRRFKMTPEFTKCVRYFGQLDEEDPDGYVIMAEWPKEKALEINREHSRKEYKKKQLKKSGIKIISYEAFISDTDPDAEKTSGESFLVDPDADTCTAVINKERDEAVRREIERLSPINRSIISDLYLSDDPSGICQCADMLGIKKSTVCYHRDLSLNALSSALSDWRWDE